MLNNSLVVYESSRLARVCSQHEHFCSIAMLNISLVKSSRIISKIPLSNTRIIEFDSRITLINSQIIEFDSKITLINSQIIEFDSKITLNNSQITHIQFSSHTYPIVESYIFKSL